jgi:hypothetical protein
LGGQRVTGPFGVPAEPERELLQSIL